MELDYVFFAQCPAFYIVVRKEGALEITRQNNWSSLKDNLLPNICKRKDKLVSSFRQKWILYHADVE